MARIRTIKPEFFANEELSDLSMTHRLFFIGLWTQSDREGRGEYRPRRLKVAIFPYETVDVDRVMYDLVDAGFVELYEVDSVTYWQVHNFAKHQAPHIKERASTIPPRCNNGADTIPAHREGKGREGKGRERETREESVDSSLGTHLANFPPCLSLTAVDRAAGDTEQRPLTAHIMRAAERELGASWVMKPANVGKLGAAIEAGCPDDCDGSHALGCAALFTDAIEKKAAYARKQGTQPTGLIIHSLEEDSRGF